MSYYIKGDNSRGAEIIALLESKGGINTQNLGGNGDSTIYYTTKNNIISCVDISYLSIIKEFCKELTLPEPKWEPKRGETVLVKYEQKSLWKEAVFSFKDGDNYYIVGGNVYLHCIPFDINKLGKVCEV